MYPSHQAEALAAGADIFLVKGCPAEDLLETILQETQHEYPNLVQINEKNDPNLFRLFSRFWLCPHAPR